MLGLGARPDSHVESSFPRSLFVRVRAPGFAAGVEREDHPAPGPGRPHPRFDGNAEAILELDFEKLAGQPLNQEAVAHAAALGIQASSVAAVEGSAIHMEGGEPDAQRREALLRPTVRWDASQHRLVIASGRRGILHSLENTAAEVRVEVHDVDDNLAEPLGFGQGAHVERAHHL